MPKQRKPDRSTPAIMLIVAACLLPGLLLQAWLLDPVGVVLNVATALITALATEHLCLYLRGSHALQGSHAVTGPGGWLSTDGSALVTALILAAALPPGALTQVACATGVALALGKHAYGGLGNNIFNPAMVGYAVVLVSFPAALSEWPLPGTSADGLSGATVLTAFKYREAATVLDLWLRENGFGTFGGVGYEWIAAAFGLGGLALFGLRLAAWRPAAGMLAALTLLSLACYDGGSSASLGSPTYHLFAGSTLLAAGFVLTDPVTHPTSAKGQWLFGLLVGSTVFVIRGWGNYPDGIAFAVLLGNGLTPFLDRRLSLAGESSGA